MVLCIGFSMERKLRLVNGSLIITIPKQVCDLYGFCNGDKMAIEPIGVGELRLRKTNSMLETFRNEGHKKEVREYLFIRERIDKVGKYTRRNDVQALATLDQFLRSKQYNRVTQDIMLEWESFLQKEIKLKLSTIEQYEAHEIEEP
ncbi:unnamed protein product, partial [marine sediment metagenome]